MQDTAPTEKLTKASFHPLYELARVFAPLLQLSKPVAARRTYKKRWIPYSQYKKRGKNKRPYKKKWIPYNKYKKQQRRR